VYAVLLVVEPDLGTTITLMLMLSAVLLVAGTPGRVLGPALLLTVGIGTAAIWFEPYRRARFFAFLHPTQDPLGIGYQTMQGLISMGSGGITGVGIGNGIGKIFYLPEASNDMILANIGEELGLICVAGVILAYAVFAYAGLRIALRCRDPFGKLLAVGLTVLVSGQAAVNIAAVMGVAPLTGIPLPFLSYGGSSLVVLLTSVGILLNIAQRGNAKAASVRDRSRGDSGTRAVSARSSGRADGTRRVRDTRRVAGSRRGSARS
jgi:cell division protein FtsW